MMNKGTVFFIALIIALFFSTCKKKDTNEVDTESQTSIDNGLADQEFMAIIPAVHAHAMNTKGTGAQYGRMLVHCDTLRRISGDTLYGLVGHVDPVYELDLAAIGCGASFPDGNSRSGKWRIAIMNRMKIAGSVMTIQLLDHKVNGMTFGCESIKVTTQELTSTYAKYKVELIKGTCKGNGWEAKLEFDRIFKYYYKGDPLGTDPVVYVTGNSSGTNRQGRSFIASIDPDSPLTKKRSCPWIQSGLIRITPDGFKERMVDYGYSEGQNPRGGCDVDASFSINGNTLAFKLK